MLIRSYYQALRLRLSYDFGTRNQTREHKASTTKNLARVHEVCTSCLFNTERVIEQIKYETYDKDTMRLIVGKKKAAVRRIDCRVEISNIFFVFSTNDDRALEKASASTPNAQEATDSMVN